MLTAETQTVGGDSLDAGDDGDEELILRIPLELCVPSNITLYNLKRVVSAKLAEAKLVPRQDPMSMFLGLNGQVCADPVACPLRMLVPGSVVSLVADLPEAHEVSRLGLCLNALQLIQVQWSGFPTSRPMGSMVPPSNALSGPRKLLPDDVMAKRRKELYKTQLCTNFAGPGGYCSFGERCHFAHGKAELRVFGKPEVSADARTPHKDEPREDSNAPKDAGWNSKGTEWKSNDTGWNWSDKSNGRNWESSDTWDNDKWKYDNSDWKWNDWSSTWDRDQSERWSDWRSEWSEWRSEPPDAIRRPSASRSRSPEASSGLVLRPVERRSRSCRSRRRRRRDGGNERGREMRRRPSRSRASGRR